MAEAGKQLELSRAAARSINDAGVALLSSVDVSNGGGGDLFLSPPSIISALSLALAAAEPGSKCERELREAISPSSESTEEALGAVSSLCALFAPSSSLSSASSSPSGDCQGPIVETANSVWCHSRCREFSPEYLSLVSALGAEAKSLSGGGEGEKDDDGGKGGSASARINGWVSEKTRKMIDGIVDEGTASRAEAILVNALYFKGKWKSKFDRQRSGPGDFFPLGNNEGDKKIRAHFMNKLFKRDTGVRVFSREGAVSLAIKLPYATAAKEAAAEGEAGAEAGETAAVDPGLFEAIFALPDPNASLSDALAALQEENNDGDGSSLWQDPPRAGVDVSVPAFRCEAPCLRLSAPLRSALKLSAPFCQASCEFTRMFSDKEAAPAIDEVLHKVAVICDEEGTEAAAATAVVMMRAMLAVDEPLRFLADRPFLFVVRHAASGLDLFVGRVAGPRAWKGEDGEDGGVGGEGREAGGVRPGAAAAFV